MPALIALDSQGWGFKLQIVYITQNLSWKDDQVKRYLGQLWT